MDRNTALGLAFLALLGFGFILLARRSGAAYSPNSLQGSGNSSIRMLPMASEPPRYRNKETRRIEYNGLGLPTLIEITRDYTVA